MQDQVKTDDFNIAMSLGGLKSDVAHLTALITANTTAATTATASTNTRVDSIESAVTILKADVAVLKSNAPTRLTWPLIIGSGAAVVGGTTGLLAFIGTRVIG